MMPRATRGPAATAWRPRPCSAGWSHRFCSGRSWRRCGSAPHPPAATIQPPFLSWTFAPVSLGAFAVLIARLPHRRRHTRPQTLGRVRVEPGLLGHRRGTQRLPAATRRHARPADVGHDARRARSPLGHRRTGPAQHALCRIALDRRLCRTRSGMAGATERREAGAAAGMERSRRHHADPADIRVRPMADHLCRCRRVSPADRSAPGSAKAPSRSASTSADRGAARVDRHVARGG